MPPQTLAPNAYFIALGTSNSLLSKELYAYATAKVTNTIPTYGINTPIYFLPARVFGVDIK